MGSTFGLNSKDINLTVNRLGVVTDSLRLYYDAGIKASYPGSGATWYDLSGNGTHCTLYGSGGTTYSANYATEPELVNLGEPPSFRFDGSNDFGKYTQFTIGSACTVSVWFKTSATSGTKGLLSHCNGGPVSVSYDITNSYPRYYYYSGGWQTWTASTAVADGTWKNLTWAKSGTSMSLYINGAFSQSTTLVADVGGNMACIGSTWGPCNSDSYGAGTDTYSTVFNGNIGAVMVHTKQLNATEVLQNYNVLKNRYRA